MSERSWEEALEVARARPVVELPQRARDRVGEVADPEPELSVEQVEVLRGQLVAAGFPEPLAATMVRLCTDTKPGRAFCSRCSCKVVEEFPDKKARLEAMKLALGYLVGRPVERRKVEVSVGPSAEYAEMSTEDLLALRASMESG